MPPLPIARSVNEVPTSGRGAFLTNGKVPHSEVDQSATLIARFPMPHTPMKIMLSLLHGYCASYWYCTYIVGSSIQRAIS